MLCAVGDNFEVMLTAWQAVHDKDYVNGTVTDIYETIGEIYYFLSELAWQWQGFMLLASVGNFGIFWITLPELSTLAHFAYTSRNVSTSSFFGCGLGVLVTYCYCSQ